MLTRLCAAAAVVPAALLVAAGSAGAATTTGTLPQQVISVSLTPPASPSGWTDGTPVKATVTAEAGRSVVVTRVPGTTCTIHQTSGKTFTVRFVAGAACSVRVDSPRTSRFARTVTDLVLQVATEPAVASPSAHPPATPATSAVVSRHSRSSGSATL